MKDVKETEGRLGEALGGDYTEITKISKGPLSVVYSAEYIPLLQRRIIKVIMKNEEGCEIYKNESSILSRVKHEHIPRIYEVGEREDFYYIVMEYIEGVTLCEYIERYGTKDLTNILIRVCNIIEFLHNLSEPILVIDIQPTNIIVRNCDVFLIDFGSGIIKKKKEARRRFSFGTIGFASPEQFGPGEVDESTDIYGIGSIILKYAQDDVLREIGYRCTQVKAHLRYEKIAELISDLEKLKSGEVCGINRTEISVVGSKGSVGVTAFSLGLVKRLRDEGYEAYYIPKDKSVIDKLRVNCEEGCGVRYDDKAYYINDIAMIYDERCAEIFSKSNCDNKDNKRNKDNKYNKDNKDNKYNKDNKRVLVYDCGRYKRTRYYKGECYVVTSASSWSEKINSHLKNFIEKRSAVVIYNMCGPNDYRKAMIRNGITGVRMPFCSDILGSFCDKEIKKFYTNLIKRLVGGGKL